MENQLRRRLRTIGLVDMFFSSCSIVYFLAAMWILATNVRKSEAFVVIGSIGTLIFVILKSIGFWTCYKLTITMNLWKHNDESNDLIQLTVGVASKWLTTKKILFVVPALTFAFLVVVYWGCYGCVIFGGGWIALEVLLIYLGSLNIKELRKMREANLLNFNQQLVYEISV